MFILVLTVIATFSLGWYLTNRFLEIVRNGTYNAAPEEVNNPRLDTKTLENITLEFNTRSLYTQGQGINVAIPEADPFYQ
jgi:hypothetical protein